jgi:hypothetical protein
MPAGWHLAALHAALKSTGVADVDVAESDIYGLPPKAASSVVDKMVTGGEFPMVIIDDDVVCEGGVDAGAVAQALA